jgi:hypothetical protein
VRNDRGLDPAAELPEAVAGIPGMKIPQVIFAALAAATVAASITACGGSPARVAGAAPAPARGVPAFGSVGDTAAFGLKLTGLAYAPDRITYEVNRPSYVTILSVSQSSIVSIIPRVDVDSRIEMAGSHQTPLTVLDTKAAKSVVPSSMSAAPILNDDARVAEVQEYNRCMARAAAASKRDEEASRRVVGRDSAGRPIYGPPTVVPNERNYENQCAQRQASTQTPAPPRFESAPGQPGRFLLIFASDTRVEHKQVLELAVTESDPRLMTIAIGRKLFGGGAIWSGLYRGASTSP